LFVEIEIGWPIVLDEFEVFLYAVVCHVACDVEMLSMLNNLLI
jgi:hypothetical protein